MTKTIYIDKSNKQTRKLLRQYRSHFVHVRGQGFTTFSHFEISIMRCAVDPEYLVLLTLQGYRLVYARSVRDIVADYMSVRHRSTKITNVAKWKCRA